MARCVRSNARSRRETRHGDEFARRRRRCRSFYYWALNSTVERYPAFWTARLQERADDGTGALLTGVARSRCHAADLQLTPRAGNESFLVSAPAHAT